MVLILLVLGSCIIETLCATSLYYSHSPITYINQTWMTNFDDGIPLRKMSIVGTHSSASLGGGTLGAYYETQASDLPTQLNSGIRALDMRCSHKNNRFVLNERGSDFGIDLGTILQIVKQFLAKFPGQTILMHIIQQSSASNNTQSFQSTFKKYLDNYSQIVWNCTTQNPNLGMTRGKIVIIQDFVGAIYGLLYGSFITIEKHYYSSIWDQYDRWVDIKKFISATNTSGSSRISFWGGYGDVYPYFCASGQTNPGNGQALTSTKLLDPPFIFNYPDFPRRRCVLFICWIDFQGINILGFQYIISKKYQYFGIIFVDFYGDALVKGFVSLNQNLFGKCVPTQKQQGCTCCNPKGMCLACIQQLPYIYNQTTSACDAAPGYYLNGSYYPILCSSQIPGCFQCKSQSECTLCDILSNYKEISGQCQAAPGYFLDNSSIPHKCNIFGCYLCSSSTTCTQCSIAYNFVMDDSGQCICNTLQYFVLSSTNQICVCMQGRFLTSNGTCDVIPSCPMSGCGCLTCNTSSNVCTTCQPGYVLNTPYCVCKPASYFDGTGCLQCSTVQPACTDCIAGQLCTSCAQNFTIIQGACICQQQYYPYDAETCLPCQVGCLLCTSQTDCMFCNTSALFVQVDGLCSCQKGMFIDVGRYGQVCVPCGAMSGCTDCNMFGCVQCDPIFGFFLDNETLNCVCNIGFYISSMSICQQCRILGCIDCDALNSCLICDSTLFYLDEQTKICKEICGDGILINLECDDGNLINFDGCSSICMIEKDFSCSGGSGSTPSSCSYSGLVTLELISYVKNTDSNQVVITAILSPAIPIFGTVNYSEAFVPNFVVSGSTVDYNPETGEITYIFTYDKSLNTDNNMSVTFNPPQTLQFFYTPNVSLSLSYTTDNNLALKPYTSQIYSLMPMMKYFVYVLTGLSCSTFILGLLSSRLMAVEMIFVIQVAYVGLSTLDKLETLMYPLINLWPVDGFNRIPLFNQSNKDLPSRIAVIGFKTYFLENFNGNMILIVLPFLVGGGLMIVGRVKKDKKWKLWGIQSCKQWGITILLFISVHLLVSVCIAIKYGSNQIYGIAIGSILIALILAESILMVIKPKNFGDYKYFFQSRSYQSNFYLMVILVRFILVGSISMLSQSIMGFCIGMGIVGLQTVMLMVVQPYRKNIRPIANNIVVLFTLGIFLGYKIRITDQIQWLTTYQPIVLLSVLSICVIGNGTLMVLHKFFNQDQLQKVKKEQYFGNIEQTIGGELKKKLSEWNETNRTLGPMNELLRNGKSNGSLLKSIRSDLKMFSRKSDIIDGGKLGEGI